MCWSMVGTLLGGTFKKETGVIWGRSCPLFPEIDHRYLDLSLASDIIGRTELIDSFNVSLSASFIRKKEARSALRRLFSDLQLSKRRHRHFLNTERRKK